MKWGFAEIVVSNFLEHQNESAAVRNRYEEAVVEDADGFVNADGHLGVYEGQIAVMNAETVL